MQNLTSAARSALVFRSTTILGLLLLLGIAASGCSKHGKELEVGKGTLYYTENVTEDEAKKLAETLQKSSHFTDKEWKAQLDKAGALWKFRLVEDAGKVNDPTFKVWLINYNLQLSKLAFNDGKVQIDLCDDDFNTLKTFPQPTTGGVLGLAQATCTSATTSPPTKPKPLAATW